VESFFRERMEETPSGYTSEVVVNIYGNRLDTLDREGGQVADILNRIPGATDVHLQSPPRMPEVVVRLRKDTLAHWGFDPLDVLGAIRTAYGGDVVGQTYQGNRVFGVDVILHARDRRSVEGIRKLPMRSPQGNYVDLGQLADVYQTSGRYVILHDGARRVQTITCNVAGRSVPSFVSEARRPISQLKFPQGAYIEFGGTA
jgi:Cu/Ag efflux pump CusA